MLAKKKTESMHILLKFKNNIDDGYIIYHFSKQKSNDRKIPKNNFRNKFLPFVRCGSRTALTPTNAITACCSIYCVPANLSPRHLLQGC